MASRDLLRDTIEYNRKINLARRVMKSMKYSPPTLPLISVGPLQPGVSADVPVESVKVMKRRGISSGASKSLWMSRKPKNTKNMCNHALYTPMAELRHKYETVLSWLLPVVVKASSGGIRKKSMHGSFAPDLSELPNTKYRVSSGFFDEMLDGLVISDRTAGCRSSLGSAPVLSDLPSTKY